MAENISTVRVVAMLHSEDAQIRASARAILMDLARKNFFGYPIEDSIDRESRLVILNNSVELSAAIRQFSSRKATIFEGLTGILSVADAAEMLGTSNDPRECIALTEALTGRDSGKIRVGLQRVQRLFQVDRACWVTATFGLYQRCRFFVDANELLERTADWCFSYKRAQVLFRLAIDGHPSAKSACKSCLSEGVQLQDFAFETICWFNCAPDSWIDHFERFVVQNDD